MASATASTEELLAALVQDALTLAPGAEGVTIELFDELSTRFRSAPPRVGQRVDAQIVSAQGAVGMVSLFAQTLDEGTRLAASALSWLAAGALDRRALRGAEHDRDDQRRRFDVTFSHAPVGIAHVSPDGRFLCVNERFAAITGRSRAELMAEGFQTITHPDDLATDFANVNRLLAGKADRYIMEKRYLRPDGSIAWVNLTVALVRDPTGAPEFFVSVVEDLSEVKRARAEATRDPLTGLLNRRGLLEHLPRELALCADSNRPLSLIYLDLDGFKRVNDALGHARGDECLVATAQVLRDAIQSRGRIARIGGDEFIFLLPGFDRDRAEREIEQLRAEIATIEIARGWHVAGSFGAATAAPHMQITANVLIAAADKAMFDDKRRRGRPAARSDRLVA